MPWADLLADAEPDLAEGASDAAIRTVERSLNCTLPPEYREFLQFADGGLLDAGHVVLYSIATGEYEDETLRVANLSRAADSPVVVIGREGDDEFGFRKVDLTGSPRAGVYVVSVEGELSFAAPSLEAFLRDLAQRIAKDRAARQRPWWKRWFGGA